MPRHCQSAREEMQCLLRTFVMDNKGATLLVAVPNNIVVETRESSSVDFLLASLQNSLSLDASKSDDPACLSPGCQVWIPITVALVSTSPGTSPLTFNLAPHPYNFLPNTKT